MAHEYDYHFMVLAPGLQGAWFTQAARDYWLKYQPIVTEHVDLLANTPPDASVAVTVLANRDNAAAASRQINASGRDVSDLHLDLIIADDLPHMESILDQRAESGQPFGDRSDEHESA